jgi:hypothetical protein
MLVIPGDMDMACAPGRLRVRTISSGASMTSGLFHAITTLAFALHIGAGTLALVSGTAAAVARKGGRVHRAAGTIFFVSMLVMAAFAAYLAVAMPGRSSICSSPFSPSTSSRRRG